MLSFTLEDFNKQIPMFYPETSNSLCLEWDWGKYTFFNSPSLGVILICVIQEPHSGTYFKSILVMKLNSTAKNKAKLFYPQNQ